MNITIICENTVATPFPRGIIGEHGLSFLIEGADCVLYDTGQGPGLLNNMQMLGKQVDAVDRLILSHGHYDHTGGLMPLLEARKNGLDVYLHPEAFAEKVAVVEMGDSILELPIGFQHSKDAYEEKGAKFNFISGFAEVSPGIFALSDVERPSNWTGFDARLKCKENGNIIDDPFNDDLSLLIETDAGPVILLGCAHAGIIDILNDFSSKTGHKKFHAVIGGTHLGSAEPAYINEAINVLKSYDVKMIGTSHCTGPVAAHMVAAKMPDEFVVAGVGITFTF